MASQRAPGEASRGGPPRAGTGNAPRGLMELEQTVAEGEACLRVAEAERDKTARRLGGQAAEAAGRLAAGSRRGSQRRGLASARGVGARAAGAGTNANDDDDDDSHGDDSPSGVESDWNGDSVQSDSDRDHPRGSFPAAKTAHTAPGTAPRGRLGDSAMDEGSPSSANSGASVASKHQPAAAGLHDRRVEYTPESKPPTRARRVVTTDPSGALAEVVVCRGVAGGGRRARGGRGEGVGAGARRRGAVVGRRRRRSRRGDARDGGGARAVDAVRRPGRDVGSGEGFSMRMGDAAEGATVVAGGVHLGVKRARS